VGRRSDRSGLGIWVEACLRKHRDDVGELSEFYSTHIQVYRAPALPLQLDRVCNLIATCELVAEPLAVFVYKYRALTAYRFCDQKAVVRSRL
jgi:hypothetical protein